MRSSPRSSLRTTATIVIALLLIAGLVAPAVLAHAQLRSSDPADGATLPTTDAVTLTFNEDINADFVQVTVSGPAGDPVAAGDPVVAGPVVTQPVAPTAAGAHTVTFRVVSADGHPVSGSIAFTLTAPAGTTDAEPSEPQTSESQASEPQTSEPTTTTRTPEPATPVSDDDAAASAAASADEQDGSGAWLALGGAGALAAVGGGIAWAALRRRHPEH